MIALKRQARDRWLFELQLWAASQGVSVWLADLQPYEHCLVAGIVRRLLIDPTAGVITASITDGTGVVDAQWALRRPTPELSVAPGRAVVLDGVTRVEGDGRLVIIPASFHVGSFPEIA